MATQFLSTAFVPRTITLGLSALDRKAVERQIEELIELLDTIDGDTDLEDDELNGDPLDEGEAEDYLAMGPVYGTDQSAGPLNEHEACEQHRRALRRH